MGLEVRASKPALGSIVVLLNLIDGKWRIIHGKLVAGIPWLHQVSCASSVGVCFRCQVRKGTRRAANILARSKRGAEVSLWVVVVEISRVNPTARRQAGARVAGLHPYS